MKKRRIIIGLVLAIIIAIIGTGVAVSGILDPYEKQIKLGYKMINEGKYEEAILAFDKAIEINEKKEKAYIGLADTYVARCDENTVKDANDALSRGYKQAQSEKIVQSYINSSQTLYDKDKKDFAIELLQNGYEVTNSEKIKAKLEELIKLISKELLDKLYKYCDSDNLEEVRKIMNTEEFVNISKYATVDTPLVYSPDKGNADTKDKKVGIYIINYNSKDIPYLYFGDYKDDIRRGYGIWLNESKKTSYIFKGNWDNDKPNGEGTIKSTQKGKVEVNQAIESEITTNFKDGLYNGEVTEKFTHSDITAIYKFTAVDGIPLEDKSLGKRGKENEYGVAIAENHDNYCRVWEYGHKGKVGGFE